MVKTRKRENVSDAFRKFNNNQADVLLINQSGSILYAHKSMLKYRFFGK